MKAWEQLTPRGRALRLRALALQALQHYDLDVKSLWLVRNDTNLVLRADTKAGASWLVRVGAPGWRTDEDIQAEMIWLDALRASDIGAPIPLAARDGRWFVYGEVPGVIPCRVTVQSWLPGTNLEKQMTPANLRKMGDLFARIHQFSAQFQAPQGFTTRQMQHYLARDEEHVLFSDENTVKFPAGAWEIYQEVNRRVLDAFRASYHGAEAPRVIHNDLWHGNIKVYRGKLLPYDFEDTLWGFPVQDVAMAMQDLMDDSPPHVYEPLLAEFRAGYERLSPWVERYEGEMDLFRAGRVLWIANYVARFQSERFSGFTESRLPMLQNFLESGQLRKPIPQA